jgi:protein-disulfide isomerase
MKKRSSGRKRSTAAPRAAAAAPARVSPLWLGLGAIFLLASVVTSLILAAEHVGGLSLPGCGPGSPCADLANSVWGKVPLGLVQWPVSFVGLAYFLGVLTAWLGSGRGVAPGLRNLVRLGVLVSLGFSAIMFVEKHLCEYCLGVHVGNLAFWIIVEAVRTRPAASIRSVATVAGVFVGASAVLGVVGWRTQVAVEKAGEQKLAEDIVRITQATGRPPTVATQPASAPPSPSSAPTVATAPAAVSSQTAATAPTSAGSTTSGPDEYPFKNGLRGRYLYGPEKAAVRIVTITDYQCPDCRRVEGEIRTLLERHPDVSLSVMHFPFCLACNPGCGRDLHPNACWAARAAEAAGIRWGNDGFWAMHQWLFDHQGAFTTTQQLEDGIRQMGRDPAGFVGVLTSDETLRRVKADIAGAELLGLFQTPMVFINGVELRGWNALNAVTRAADAALAAHLEPQTHADDHPPLAFAKALEDWRQQPMHRLPTDPQSWPLGPDAAQISVAVFGDYQEPITAEADGIIRGWLTGRADAQYVFRPYPFDTACNPHVSSTKFAQGCWAARAAAAAGRLGGNEAYWRLHIWLMSHQQSFADDALRQAAGELGLDPDALLAALQQDEVAAAVRDDLDAGKRLNVNSIPTIYVNGKLIAHWRDRGAEWGRRVVEGVLNEAATSPPAP